ncbi:helix-turn-helix domain-containing protein [Schaalia hyovaginalis]|nr:helix-turn-helix transcriptional regulator [Schaalia hyovaginalis]
MVLHMEAQHADSPNEEWRRVGATIRTMREIRGLNPDELAREIHISTPHLRNIENGHRALTEVLLTKIAKALVVPQIALLRDGYFDSEWTEAQIEAKNLERRVEKLQDNATALADEVEGLRAALADLLARAKAVA